MSKNNMINSCKKSKENMQKNNCNNIKAKSLKSSAFDPFGSYTGVSIDGSKPIQDQDDL